jgi:hypothetical protein
VVHSDLNLNSLRASGEVWFPDSTIDGDLRARGGHFTHSRVESQETEAGFKKALDLESSRIGGDVWLCCGFEADGAVNLRNHKKDRQFESPPLYQRVTANRQRSHLTRQSLRLQQICSNATRN